MHASQNSRVSEYEALSCAETLPAESSIATEANNQVTPFKCDACMEDIPIPQAVTSLVLSGSHFCSINCRDEAELAAENVRQVGIVLP